MKKIVLALVALATAGATAASAAPADGRAGVVVARADDGSFDATCSFTRDAKGGVTFAGAHYGVAGQTSISCSVTAGGFTLTEYGGNTVSGSGSLPAGSVTVCVDASVVRFVDSSHASGCAKW